MSLQWDGTVLLNHIKYNSQWIFWVFAEDAILMLGFFPDNPSIPPPPTRVLLLLSKHFNPHAYSQHTSMDNALEQKAIC